MPTPEMPFDDELLSAYVDGELTESERQRVEAAMASDPDIAWQVETLRQTVQLLSDLPLLEAPRSFTLSEEQVARTLAFRRENRPRRGSAIWGQLLDFFNSGNLALRNASAVAATLLVILLVGTPLLEDEPEVIPLTPPLATSQEIAALPAAESAAVEPVPEERSLAPESVSAEVQAAPAVADAPPETMAPYAVDAEEGPQAAPLVAPRGGGLPDPFADEGVTADAVEMVAPAESPGVTERTLIPPEAVEAEALPAVEARSEVIQPESDSLEEESSDEAEAPESFAMEAADDEAVSADEATSDAGESAPSAATMSEADGAADVADPMSEAEVEEAAPIDAADSVEVAPVVEPAPDTLSLPKAADPVLNRASEEESTSSSQLSTLRMLQIGFLVLTILLLLLWWRSRSGSSQRSLS